MKKKDPTVDLTSLGNIVVALYNVPLKTVWRIAAMNRPIGERLVEEGLITKDELEAALATQRVLRAGHDDARAMRQELMQDITDEVAALRALKEDDDG